MIAAREYASHAGMFLGVGTEPFARKNIQLELVGPGDI